MRGLVVKNTGSWYSVRSEEGRMVECKVKGNFRLKGIRSTNPVAIGDHVEFIPQPDNTALITEIDERKNYIIRKSTNLSKQSHIIAANLDQCFLIVTINHPETSTTFIDRFLATAEAYSIPVTIVFNKIDIYNEDDKILLEGMINLYETIGYKCLSVSVKTGEGMNKIADELAGKVTLLSGNSGVGKSTFINYLLPELKLKTSEISDAYDTGKHTTTFSEMYQLKSEKINLKSECSIASEGSISNEGPISNEGSISNEDSISNVECKESYIIDTPGIKGFGTFDMEREEVGHYFKEIFHYSQDCRFNNCTHTHEPGCAVREAVERHDISESRFNSYLSMLEDEKEDRYRSGY